MAGTPLHCKTAQLHLSIQCNCAVVVQLVCQRLQELYHHHSVPPVQVSVGILFHQLLASMQLVAEIILCAEQETAVTVDACWHAAQSQL